MVEAKGCSKEKRILNTQKNSAETFGDGEKCKK